MIADHAKTQRHPNKAFLVLFFMEVWERFGYYGMASLLVLYMVQQRRFDDTRADLVWGASRRWFTPCRYSAATSATACSGCAAP